MDTSPTNIKISGTTAPLQFPRPTSPKAVDFSVSSPSSTALPQDLVNTSPLGQGSAKVQSFAMEGELQFPEMTPRVTQNLQRLAPLSYSHSSFKEVVRSLQSLVIKNPTASGAEIAQALEKALAESAPETQNLAKALVLTALEPAELDQLCQQLENKLQASSGHHQAEDPAAVEFAITTLKNNITYNSEEIASLLKGIQGLVLNANLNSWTPEELQNEINASLAQFSPAAQSFAHLIDLESMNLNTLTLLNAQTQDIQAAIERVRNLDVMNRFEQRMATSALNPGLNLEQEVNLTTGESRAITEIKAPDAQTVKAVQEKKAAMTEQTAAAKYGTLLAQADPTSLNAKDQGLDGLLHLLNQSGSDATKLFQAILSGKDPNTVNINLEARQNYILAKILGMNNDQQVNALIQSLQKFQSGGTLSPSDLSTLENAGIKIQDGKAYNLANAQLINTADLQNLAQVAQHMLSTSLAGDSESVKHMKTLRPQIATAFQGIQRVRELGATIERNKELIAQGKEELAQTNQQVQAAQTRVERSETTAQAAASDLEKAQTLWNSIRNQGLSFLLQQARAGGLLEINRLLRELDISIAVQGDQITISQAGKPLTQEEFQARLETWVKAKTDHLIQTRNQLQQDREDLSTWQTRANTLAEKLTGLVRNQGQLIQEQRANLAELRQKTLPELEALKRDPAQWAQLSDQEKSLVDSLLQDGRKALEEEEARLADAERLNAEALAAIAQTAALNQRSESLLTSSGKTLGEIDKRLNTQLQADTQALIAHADELSQKLTLAPRPANLDTAQMSEEWLRSLEKLESQLKQQLKQELQNDEIEKQFTTQNAQKALRRLEYHLKQLKTLDLRQTERVEQILKSSVQRTSKELSALLVTHSAD